MMGSIRDILASHVIHKICPPLHHPTPLGQVFRVVVCGTNSILLSMRKLTLDPI